MAKISIDGSVTSDDLLGKKVIDSDGEFIGVAEKLHIDPNSIEIVGISIDKGFLRKGLVIGKAYIQRVAKHAVFLNIAPSFKLKGMLVFDSEGKKVGTVVDVQLQDQTNKVKRILVSTGGNKILIDSSYIGNAAENVILNEKKENLVLEK